MRKRKVYCIGLYGSLDTETQECSAVVNEEQQHVGATKRDSGCAIECAEVFLSQTTVPILRTCLTCTYLRLCSLDGSNAGIVPRRQTEVSKSILSCKGKQTLFQIRKSLMDCIDSSQLVSCHFTFCHLFIFPNFLYPLFTVLS